MYASYIWERLKRIKESAHAQAAVLLIVVLCVFYRDVVFFSHTFLMLGQAPGTMPTPEVAYGYPGPPVKSIECQTPDAGALAWIVEPYEFHNRECFRRGELPLWDPYCSMGQPHLGSGHAGVFDPLCLLVYIAPRVLYPCAYDFEVLLRLFVCGFFTYLFLRRLDISWWPACFGGAAFMLMNYGIDWGSHTSFKVFALMPIMFYALERLRKDVSFENALGCAGIVVWLILADFSEAAFVAFQCAGLYILCRAIFDIWNSKHRFREAQRQCTIIFLAFIPGLLLGAPIVFPQIENVALSGGEYHGVDAGAGSIAYSPLSYILTFIPYYAGPVGIRYSPHFHLVAILLALTSIFSMRRMLSSGVVFVFFVAYFVFFSAKVFGGWGTAWIGHLPIYRQVHLVRYLTATLEFALAALAAMGLEHVLDRRHAIHSILGASLVLGIAFGIALFYQLGATNPWDFQVFIKQLVKLIVIVSIFLGVLLLSNWFRWPRSVTALGSIVGLVIELLVWHKNFTRPMRWDPYTPPPFVQYLREQPTPFRTFATNLIMCPNTFMGHGLEDIRECTAIVPLRTKRFFQGLVLPEYSEVRMYGTEPVQRTQFFNLLNVKYILTLDIQPDNPVASSEFFLVNPAASALHHYELLYDKEIRVYRNNNVFPRAFVVHAIEQSENYELALRRMQLPDFNAARVAVIDGPNVPENAALRLSPHDWPKPTPVEVTRHATNSVSISAALAKPGLLVLSDTYFPGWHAYVDGKEAPIYPTDVALRGVYLDAGNHTVEFIYWPQSFVYGLYLAASVVMSFLGWGLWRRVRPGSAPIPAQNEGSTASPA